MPQMWGKALISRISPLKARAPGHNKWASWSAIIDSEALRRDLKVISAHKAQEAQSLTPLGDASSAYWMQGDLSLNTGAAWEARMLLRADPMVEAELENWWLAIERSGSLSESDCQLKKDEYIDLQIRLYRALIEDAFDADDAEQCAEEGWASDCPDGQDGIDEKALKDSMFETADICAHTRALARASTRSPLPFDAHRALISFARASRLLLRQGRAASVQKSTPTFSKSSSSLWHSSRPGRRRNGRPR